jgi:hypothetical protein
MTQPDDLREALSSEVYERAFSKVMSGVDPASLPDDERDAIRRAKDVTGTGAGYPMPWRLDPTRNQGQPDA